MSNTATSPRIEIGDHRVLFREVCLYQTAGPGCENPAVGLPKQRAEWIADRPEGEACIQLFYAKRESLRPRCA